MEQAKIDRINELAKKAKEGPLTPEETAERQTLRAEYRAAIRRSLADQLDNTYVKDEATGATFPLRPINRAPDETNGKPDER